MPLNKKKTSSSFMDFIERQEKGKYNMPHEQFNTKIFITRKKYTEVI
jgi:hypothetical protein